MFDCAALKEKHTVLVEKRTLMQIMLEEHVLVLFLSADKITVHYFHSSRCMTRQHLIKSIWALVQSRANLNIDNDIYAIQGKVNVFIQSLYHVCTKTN